MAISTEHTYTLKFAALRNSDVSKWVKIFRMGRKTNKQINRVYVWHINCNNMNIYEYLRF